MKEPECVTVEQVRQLASNPSSPRPALSDTENTRLPKSHSEPELATRYEDMANKRPTGSLKKGYINFVAAAKPLVMQDKLPSVPQVVAPVVQAPVQVTPQVQDSSTTDMDTQPVIIYTFVWLIHIFY